MRQVLCLTVALLCSGSPAGAAEKGYKAGQAHERTTAGGVRYAVYLPRKWKRGKPLPVVLHVPNQRALPIEFVSHPGQQETFERFNAAGGGVIVCSILLQAHNRENPFWKKKIDVPRYLTLLDLDIRAMDAVIADLERDLAIEPDVWALQGQDFSCEVALGIATRRPDRFMALLVREIRAGTYVRGGEAPRWDVLPPRDILARALDLPILFDVIYDAPTQEKRTPQNRRYRDALEAFGFRRVRYLEPDLRLPRPPRVHPDYFRAYDEILASTRARRVPREKRDRLLSAAREALGRRNLGPALEAYRKALALEEEHGLRAQAQAVYAELEAEGRRRLAEAEALSSEGRMAAHRELARLFAGTPLGKALN